MLPCSTYWSGIAFTRTFTGTFISFFNSEFNNVSIFLKYSTQPLILPLFNNFKYSLSPIDAETSSTFATYINFLAVIKLKFLIII